MIIVRKSLDRGKGKADWLESFHTFSFGHYHDPEFMGFGPLRVINEDFIQAGMGFDTHSHENMEIMTYVVEGELEHKDSMGTGSIIKPGEIQKMSAGSGVKHSEFNHSKTKLLHLLQIWIIPAKEGIEPAYEQKTIPVASRNELLLIGSPTGSDSAISIQQAVHLYAAYLDKSAILYHPVKAKHALWVQVVKGELDIMGTALKAGDGAAIVDEELLTIQGVKTAEFLLFDFG